jgi:hypothetical protein
MALLSSRFCRVHVRPHPQCFFGRTYFWNPSHRILLSISVTLRTLTSSSVAFGGGGVVVRRRVSPWRVRLLRGV